MTEQRKCKLKRQLQESRFRLIIMFEEFAEPLNDIVFVATDYVYHISTNGKYIYFDPDWLQKLEKPSLDFILCHELMHISLNHINRNIYFKGDKYHFACDIVANAKLYEMGWQYKKLPGIGEIYTKTFYPEIFASFLTCEEAFKFIPFDPAKLSAGKRRTYMIDSEAYWDKKREKSRCGEIVLSPYDDDPDDLKFENTTGNEFKKPGGERPHVTHSIGGGGGIPALGNKGGISNEITPENANDSEEKVEPQEQEGTINREFSLMDDIKDIREIKEQSEKEKLYSELRNRTWQKTNKPTINWRNLLNSFLQQDVFDYSFTPPDKRFQDFDFYLPDYNDTITVLKEIWFMVDTSGSVEDEALSAVYNEICGSLEQFNGTVTGRIMFFDTEVYKGANIENSFDFRKIIPLGGGGTDFSCIFRYIDKSITKPSCIVIFTDGESDFPPEKAANNIPVLWIIDNKEIIPPWGKIVRV